ncbi:hypothetical protein D3C72_1864170 [compost metagenome]
MQARWQRGRAVQRQHHLREFVHAEIALAKMGPGGFHWVAGDGLAGKRFSTLAHQALAGDHARGLADIDADPAAPQPLGNGCGGARAAESVKDEGAFGRRGLDDPLQQFGGFLGGVVNAFARARCRGCADIRP